MVELTVSDLLERSADTIKQTLATVDSELRAHGLSVDDVIIRTDQKYTLGQRTPDQIFYVEISAGLRT